MKLKRAIIVHGWEGYPEEAWFPWLKKELETLGMEVEVPTMPDPVNPKMNEWVPHLKGTIGNPNEETCLIGHSLGCITILRYLEGLREGKKIGKVVMVGGFTDPLGYKELENYFKTNINWDEIMKHCRKFTAINSDNDQYVPIKHAGILKEKLNADVVIEHSKGHMGGDEDLKILPSVLEAVKE
jgi:predicted alpha/beta hydrolase family esterase